MFSSRQIDSQDMIFHFQMIAQNLVKEIFSLLEIFRYPIPQIELWLFVFDFVNIFVSASLPIQRKQSLLSIGGRRKEIRK